VPDRHALTLVGGVVIAGGAAGPKRIRRIAIPATRSRMAGRHPGPGVRSRSFFAGAAYG